jgi:hypothetical protein
MKTTLSGREIITTSHGITAAARIHAAFALGTKAKSLNDFPCFKNVRVEPTQKLNDGFGLDDENRPSKPL